MIEAILALGLFFLSIGTLGLLRLSGTLERMHATTEATTLGVGFVVLAGALQFYPDGAYLSALLALVFLFLTAPTGGHMIARADYLKNKDEGEKKDTSGKTLEDFVP